MDEVFEKCNLNYTLLLPAIGQRHKIGFRICRRQNSIGLSIHATSAVPFGQGKCFLLVVIVLIRLILYPNCIEQFILGGAGNSLFFHPWSNFLSERDLIIHVIWQETSWGFIL